MIHRMNDQITLTRQETIKGERNRVTTTELPPRTVYGCIRDVQSTWNQNNTDPAEWEYKASLAFPLQEDVRKDDTVDLPGHGVFVVVDVKTGHRFLTVTAVQWKRGAEE